MTVKFGKYGVFEDTIQIVGVNDISTTFPDVDQYCYVILSRGEGNHFVVFDDEKAGHEQIMELTCDMYRPCDGPDDRRYEDQFFEQHMYKIPYSEVEKMLDKVIISFTMNGVDYIPLENLKKVFGEYGNNFSIVPLKRKFEFLVVLGDKNKILKDEDFPAFDAESFIEAMHSFGDDYFGYDSYFNLVLTIINDLRKNGFNDIYRELSSKKWEIIEVRTRDVFKYLDMIKRHSEKQSKKPRSRKPSLVEGANLYT